MLQPQLFSGAEHEADEPNDPVPHHGQPHADGAQAEVEAQQIAAPHRTTSMEVMEMTMGTLTSPAARRALGMVKARGQNSIAQPLWMKMSTAAYHCVSGVRL